MITRKRSNYFRNYRKTHWTKPRDRRAYLRDYRKVYKRKERAFRAWDCEGRTFRDGSHHIVLLANSDGEYIENESGLTSVECLEFLCKPRPKAFNVWFSFGYDVAQMLRQMPLGNVEDGEYVEPGTLAALWKNGRTLWKTDSGSYIIKYVPSKFFHVRRKRSEYDVSKSEHFRSFDTFGFFQRSFIEALKEWDIDSTSIQQGKDQRANFAKWSLKKIREYNDKEMALLVTLMNKLRDGLRQADLLPKSWHGPGAIAHVWMEKEGLKKHFGSIPERMIEPTQRAYFGGRIDIGCIGEVTCHKHDITSAYPAGLTNCISLSTIRWEHKRNASANDEHALYHVRWNTATKEQRSFFKRKTGPIAPENGAIWQPFPWRANDGSVLFPDCSERGEYIEGWYWGIEVFAAERLFPNCIERIEAWYPIGEKLFPFAVAIERDFVKRKETGKDTGLGRALKLALNSLYGKTAQHQIEKTQDIQRRPVWQNFIWAGFITAFTRSKILDAIAEVGDRNVYEVMTDGLLTNKKLRETGSQLGEWEYTGRSIALILQAGLYAFFTDGKCKVTKARGIPSNVNFGYMLRDWGCTTNLDTPGPNTKVIKYNTFIGIGAALHNDREHFGRFIQKEKKLKPVGVLGTNKRESNLGYFAVQDFKWKGWKKKWLRARRPKKKQTDQSLLSRPYKYRPEYEDIDDVNRI